jgi:TolB protein
MTNPVDPNGIRKPSRKKKPSRRRRISISPLTFYVLIAVILFLLGVLGFIVLQTRFVAFLGTTDTQPEVVASSTPSTASDIPEDIPHPMRTIVPPEQAGLLILSMQEGLDTHLFAYRPSHPSGDTLPLTRLTSGAWDDITPALETGGLKLAFSSNRDGQWQIYVWNIENDSIGRLTDAPGYKASPTWSPDGLWLAYERYFDNNLELYIQQAEVGAEPIQLTSNLAADYAPAWSPQGRQIAFVSTRAGREQIWLADLDKSDEERFLLLQHMHEVRASKPVWSSDGRYLLWAAVMDDGFRKIIRWDSHQPGLKPVVIGMGDQPALSHDGSILYTTIQRPHGTYLTAYVLEQPDLIWMPLLPLPGYVEDISWANLTVAALLPDIQLPDPTPLWYMDMYLDEDVPGGRWELVDLPDIEAPYSQLHDRVDEAFLALRAKLTELTGWDLLARLENAYVPLTSPLYPDLEQDWLYTGRAFTFNTLPISAGWMAVVREDYGQETYWRVYLRTRYQDGTQGRPLQFLPWDFNARFRAEPGPYEQGGEVSSSIPPGYWVDLTDLAISYGWQRLPGLSRWRSVYTDARFNEFVRTDGLDWQTAMLELYPREVVISPTPIPTYTPTPTPSNTPSITLTPTISQTPTVTNTATNKPAGWQSPTVSKKPEPTGTITPTNTLWPTQTP